jgi:NAD(P)-dependent dehydrogenase (short-subunit alcohol dehydrogenase family)
MRTAFHLHEKTILITGATSGIGSSICQQVAAMGGKLIITGRNQDKLDKLLSELPGNDHRSIIFDASVENDISNLVEEIPELHGMVNGIAQLQPFPLKMLDEAKMIELFRVNFFSTAILVSKILRSKKFSTGASVVFISSVSSRHPYVGGALYTTAKMALENYSKILALEAKNIRLRSNCILPAMVKSGMYDQSEVMIGKENMEEHLKQYPLGPGEPADVANATVFLLSDASKWMSGTSLVLDGGLTLFP